MAARSNPGIVGPPARCLAGDLRAALLIVSAVMLVYLNSLLGEFQFDDFNVIVDNPAVHAWPASARELLGIRPLLKASYTLGWVSGLGLFGFHVFNLLVHIANALLVYGLARQMQAELDPRASDSACHAALVGALLFALHPAHTEAVTYISGRSSSLMTLFYLASVATYLHGRRPGAARWAGPASPALFALALATKEVALTLPFALLLWEACIGRWGDGTAAILRRLRMHGAVLSAAVLAIAWSSTYRALLVPALQWDTLPTQVEGVGYLLFRLVRIDALNIDPDLRVQPQWTAGLAVQGLGLAMLLGAGLLAIRRRPWLGLGILWFFLQCLPTNSIVLRWDIANERQLYIADIGLFIAAGIEIGRLKDRLPRLVVKSGVAALVLALGLTVILRNHDYGSQLRLWEQAALQSPLKARVHNNLGYARRLAGDREGARQSFRLALALEPRYALAQNNLLALERQEVAPASVVCLIRLNPGRSIARSLGSRSLVMTRMPKQPMERRPLPFEVEQELPVEPGPPLPIVARPDGFYWQSPDGKEEFGPFETLELAAADRDAADEHAPTPGESLQEAESELGIADWIDPETGEPAEGMSPPHLDTE